MIGMYISICSIPVDVIIKHDEDFRKIGEYIELHITKFIEQMNAANSGVVFKYNPKFVQESMNFKFGNRNRDIAFDTEYADYYDKTFKIVFGSHTHTQCSLTWWRETPPSPRAHNNEITLMKESLMNL